MNMQFSDSSDRETAEAYEEGLAQLTDNARHVIMHLTELAHDYARDKKERIIVAVIERHIRKVKSSHKLPCLYLMDSIVKNHQVPYRDLFQQNIVSTFASVFAFAPEKVRSLMYKLRNTWTDIFTPTKLFQLDNKVKTMDPAWPIVSLPAGGKSSGSSGSSSSASSGNIHVNPAVFNRPRDENAPIVEELQRKERELLELRKKKIELELEVARKEVQDRQSKVERDSKSSQQRSSSKKTGDDRGSSQRRDPRIREKSDSGNKASENSGSLDVPKSSDSNRPSSPSNRYEKDQKSSSHRSKSSSSFSPSKSKSSSHDRSRKSKESPSSSSSSSRSSKKGNSAIKKSTSSSSKSSKSPPSSPKKRGREASISPTPETVSEQVDDSPPIIKDPSRVKDLGRIPKKASKRTDDSTLFCEAEEAPIIAQSEIKDSGNFSKSLNNNNNKRRALGGPGMEDSPPEKKKKDLPIDLFGSDMSPEQESSEPHSMDMNTLPSPSSGWAKFKETNPDEYHTPMRNNRRPGQNDRFNIGNDFRGGRGGFGHRRSRPDRRHCGGMGVNDFGPFEHGGGNLNNNCANVNNNGGDSGNNASASSILNNNMIEMVLQNMQNPEHVRNEVIPTIVKQARENLQSGRMNNTQFSELMRQVMTLKEQAMMIQAERRSNDSPFPNQQLPSQSNFTQNNALPFFNQPMFNGGDVPPSQQPPPSNRPPFRPHVRDLPQASIEDLELIKNDPVKTIPIDRESREIRQYGEVCTVVMGDCDIKELSFQPGTRRVIIDDNIIVPCKLDVKHYTSVMIDGVEHNIKIGAPTRELWVDGQWYECYFDNKVRVRLGMNFHTFFLEGPAPTVKIGERRPDLCPGRVNLIIDADFSQMTPIFLDPKPQQFDIDGKPHVIRFVEGLKTVLINGHPYRTEFGGMPMVIFVEGIKHFVRLTVLPRGVIPGQVKIRNMPMGLGNSNVATRCADEELLRPPTAMNTQSSMDDPSPPPINIRSPQQPSFPESENSNGASLENVDEVGSSSAFDKLLPLFPKSTASDNDNQIDNYQSGEITPMEEAKEPQPATVEASDKNDEEESVDVHNLWKQLLGAGLVSGGSNGLGDGSKGKKTIPGLDTSISHEEELNKENMNPEEETQSSPAVTKREPATPEAKASDIKPIVLKSHNNSLKERQQSIVNMLYDPSALQCKNCGLRYSPADMISYSQHLDWHFRMKRREKDNAKKAQSRRWYFERVDWTVSDEIEEEEKENTNTEPNETEKEIPTVPASQSKEANTCPICKEEFEQFYKDDTDEDGKWLLYNAIQRDNGTFHPQCFQDFTEDKKDLSSTSLISQEEEDSAIHTQSEEDSSVLSKGTKVEVKEEPMDTEEKLDDEDQKGQVKKEELDPKTENDCTEQMDEDIKAKTEFESEVKQEPTQSEDDEEMKELSEDTIMESPTPQGSPEQEEEETLDGMEDKSLPVLSAPKTIRVNLTTPLPGSGASSPKVDSEENTESVAEASTEAVTSDKTESEVETTALQQLQNESQVQEVNDEEAEFDPGAIIQNSERDSDAEDTAKPGLKGKKLIVIPPQKKDGELSGLCSIM